MAIAFVRSTGEANASNSSSVSVSFSTLPSAGSFILVQGMKWANDALISVTNNQGDTFTIAVESPINSNAWAFIAYAMNIGTTSGTYTITCNGPAGSYWNVVATEWTGLVTTGALDKTASSSGNNTTPTSTATATTSQADELIAGAVAIDGAMTSITAQTLSPAWTERLEHLVHDTVAGEAITRVVSATGTQTANWTIDPADHWSACIATFKAAADGGATLTPDVAAALLTGYGPSMNFILQMPDEA